MATNLKTKLHPKRFTKMSSRMASIVAYIIGENWVTPQVDGLMVTSDGFVLASVQGDLGYNHFIGDRADLERNFRTLLDSAELTPKETAEANRLFAEKVQHC
jgi:hypothetical protein